MTRPVKLSVVALSQLKPYLRATIPTSFLNSITIA